MAIILRLNPWWLQFAATPAHCHGNHSSDFVCFSPVCGPEQEFEKSEKDIMNEIQAIIRQITASVTFLPLLQDACTFDLLVYTDNDVSVPQAWEESEPKYINNQQEVHVRFPLHSCNAQQKMNVFYSRHVLSSMV
jgi:hypothetical protein